MEQLPPIGSTRHSRVTARIHRAVGGLALFLFVVTVAAVALAILHLAKSALGINFYEQRHLSDFIGGD
jgi:hypothetical protein